VTGSIAPVSGEIADVDLYRFTVAAGQRVSFDLDGTSQDFNSVL